jgi:hypothetical protein
VRAASTHRSQHSIGALGIVPFRRAGKRLTGLTQPGQAA